MLKIPKMKTKQKKPQSKYNQKLKSQTVKSNRMHRILNMNPQNDKTLEPKPGAMTQIEYFISSKHL